MNTLKVVGASLLGLALVVALAIGGRELGWWLKADNVNRQVKIDNTNVGTQTAWRDEVNELMNTIELLPEGASQRGGLVNQACELADRLTDNYMTDQIAAFESANC